MGTIAAKYLKNIAAYDQYGYGIWTDGGPLALVPRSDVMPAAYDSPSGNKPLKLLRFFAITDIHIMDKETPSQLLYLQQLNQYGFECQGPG